MALIGDNVDNTPHWHNPEGVSKEEETDLFIMSDDGSGHSINIPSYFIRKRTADEFKKVLNEGDTVIVQVKIEATRSEKPPQVILWFSTILDLSEHLLEDLREYLFLLEEKIDLEIKIRTQPCTTCPYLVYTQECVNDGQYCPLSPQASAQKETEDDDEDSDSTDIATYYESI